MFPWWNLHHPPSGIRSTVQAGPDCLRLERGRFWVPGMQQFLTKTNGLRYAKSFTESVTFYMKPNSHNRIKLVKRTTMANCIFGSIKFRIFLTVVNHISSQTCSTGYAVMYTTENYRSNTSLSHIASHTLYVIWRLHYTHVRLSVTETAASDWRWLKNHKKIRAVKLNEA